MTPTTKPLVLITRNTTAREAFLPPWTLVAHQIDSKRNGYISSPHIPDAGYHEIPRYSNTLLNGYSL